MSLRLLLALGTLSLVSLAGCSVETATPDDGQTSESADEARRLTPCATVRCAAGTHCEAKGPRASCVPNEQTCNSDSDCRLFDNYCDGCACNALSTSSPDPVCGGTTVACFAQPCMGKAAACVGGTCKVTTPAVGVQCGPNTCKVGDVCCNSSCGICTPPGGMCIQLACAPQI